MGIIFDIIQSDTALHISKSNECIFFTVSNQTLCKILASNMNVIFGIIQSDIVLQTHKPNRYNFDNLSDTLS